MMALVINGRAPKSLAVDSFMHLRAQNKLDLSWLSSGSLQEAKPFALILQSTIDHRHPKVKVQTAKQKTAKLCTWNFRVSTWTPKLRQIKVSKGAAF